MRLAAGRCGGILGVLVLRRRSGVAPFLEDERELAVEFSEGGAQGALKPWIWTGAEVAGNAVGCPPGQLPDTGPGAKEPAGEDAYAEHRHERCVLDAHRMPQRCDCLSFLSPPDRLPRAAMHLFGHNEVSFPY